MTVVLVATTFVAVVMKPGGIVMTMVSVGTRVVAVVKPMTILVLGEMAPAARLAGAKVTAVI